MALFLEHYGLTDAGKVRQNNEDALLVGDGKDTSLFAVADGIGGFEAGEVASSIAIETLKDLEPDGSFETAIRAANHQVLDAARSDERFSGMGTTVVAVRFSGTDAEPSAEVAHVGDSRAYLLRDDELRPLTEDHSLVAELVRSGDLTRAQAAEHPQRNLITRALGAEEDVEADVSTIDVAVGDRILLCSDGLSDLLTEGRIREVLLTSSEDLESPARQLLSEALEAGGTDNITIVLVDVKRQEPPRKKETPRKRRNLLSNDSGGTREMQAIDPMALPDTRPVSRRRSRGARSSSRRRRDRRKRRRGSIYPRLLAGFVRLVALALVVVVALTPVYLWGGSRYFLDFDDGEVVAYRGVPYEVFGVQLNEEWRRTGIERSEVKDPYRERVENQQLRTREEVETTLRALRN